MGKLETELREAAQGRILLPIREVAKLMGVPLGTIRNGMSRRDKDWVDFPVRKIGGRQYVSVSDLAAWLESKKEAA